MYFVTASKPQCYSPANQAAVTRHLTMLLQWQGVKEEPASGCSAVRGHKGRQEGCKSKAGEQDHLLGKQHQTGRFQNKHDTTEEMGSLTTDF